MVSLLLWIRFVQTKASFGLLSQASSDDQFSRSVILKKLRIYFRGTINSGFIPFPPLALTASTCYKVIGGSLSYLQVPGESPGYLI